MIEVTLQPHHIEFADAVARRRRHDAIMERRDAGNASSFDDDRMMSLHIMGTRAEAACKLYLNPIRWHAYHRRGVGEHPDLGDFIDVKCTSKRGGDLVVKPAPKGRRHWAYLLCFGHRDPTFQIVGWCWGDEAMAEPLRRFGTAPAAHYVPARMWAEGGRLLPPETLHMLVHDRER